MEVAISQIVIDLNRCNCEWIVVGTTLLFSLDWVFDLMALIIASLTRYLLGIRSNGLNSRLGARGIR